MSSLFNIKPETKFAVVDLITSKMPTTPSSLNELFNYNEIIILYLDFINQENYTNI